MQKLLKGNRTKKIWITILIVIMCNFIIPTYSHAEGFGGVLFDPIKMIVAYLGDSVMTLINSGFSGSWIGVATAKVKGEGDWKNYWAESGDKLDWPTIIVTPEEIFSGKVLALNVDFLSEPDSSNIVDLNQTITNGVRQQIQDGKKIGIPGDENTEGSTANLIGGLRKNISKWYLFIRNISVAALFCVLIYVGIRMVLSSASEEKAKYKSMIMNWVVAICLVFVLHYIMSLVMFTTEKLVEVIGNGTSSADYTIKRLGAEGNPKPDESFTFVKNVNGIDEVDPPDDAGIPQPYNLMEYVRVYVNAEKPGLICATYLIIYIILVAFTVIFVFKYLKRFMYMAFLTMIAPIVAFTYPIDKMGDGSAQAFNKWFMEYLFNALLQPLHLLIYVVLVGSAAELAKTSFIYTIAALAFINQSEKLLKEFFGLNRASTTGGSGGAFAAGALASNAINALKKGGSGGGDKSLPSGGSGGSGRTSGGSKPRQVRGLDVYSSGSSSEGNISGSPTNPLPQGGAQPEEWQQPEIGPWSKTRYSKEEWEARNGEGNQNMPTDETRLPEGGETMLQRIHSIENSSGEDASKPPENKDKKKITGYRKGRLESVRDEGWKALKKGVRYKGPKIAGKLARGALRTAGVVTGGIIGGAMAVATGDAKYLAGGIGAGAVLAGKTADFVSKTPNTARKIRTAYRQERLGSQAAETKEKVAEFMKDKDNLKYIKQQHNLSSDKEAKDYIKKNASEYIGAGYTNAEDISRLMKTKETMEKQGVNMTSDQIMAADAMSNEFKYDQLMEGEDSLKIQDGLTNEIMRRSGVSKEKAEENAHNHMNAMRVSRGIATVSKEQVQNTRNEINTRREESERTVRRTGGRTSGRSSSSARTGERSSGNTGTARRGRPSSGGRSPRRRR